MSEYWKSNPKKHCDFCKVWIADNKPVSGLSTKKNCVFKKKKTISFL
jgi:hypothetical protein